jgi:hypothetical protein
VTVCVRSPPLTVTVAVRRLVVVLAAAVTLTVPLLLPEVGETVSHETSLSTVQLTLEVTVTGLGSPAAVKSSVAVDTVSVFVGGT